MVRVISVHHFISQNVQTVEQPTACATVPPDKFLLALMSNCIEVRELKNHAEVLFTFPTVDEVIQICHSLNGDYVATLETKFNRQNKEINFVRIYLNWNSIATLQQSKMNSNGVSLGLSECGMVQPMRARIAGRVTPTSNQSEVGSLEMIEIPLCNEKNPNSIACCPVTGNILVLSGNVLTFHKFMVKSHDISRLKFVDFEDVGVVIQLSFEPTKIEMCENYVCAMNSVSLHLFRVERKGGKVEKNHELDSKNTSSFETSPLDYAALKGNKEFTINLPSIARENSLIHKHCPFMAYSKEMKAGFCCNSLEKYQVIDLLKYHLTPMLIENAQRHINEEFKTFVLKPLYVDEKFQQPSLSGSRSTAGASENAFRGEFSNCLNSVSCMVATSQEGYMFFIDDNEDVINGGVDEKCIGVYPFTAPVYQLVMEDCFLHALTETGLESYTLRIGHQLCHKIEPLDNVNLACPPVSDGVCLVGLRPFLGVEQILISENNLLLLANADVSPTHSVGSNSSSNAVYWTLYSLELPRPLTVFEDVTIVANVHKFTSLQTYRHLMNEAHMVIRTVMALKKFASSRESSDSVGLVVKCNGNAEGLLEVFRNSCALLADHFVMCKEQFKLAVPYYKMAGIKAVDVIRRVKKLQEQSNSLFMKGLLYYVKHIMSHLKNRNEVDNLFSQNSKQIFLEHLLNLLEVEGFEDLPVIILKSRILQDYSTDKLIVILTEKLQSNFAEKNLALCLLYIRKNNLLEAERCLYRIEPVDELFELILGNYPEILFENMTNFSELAEFLINNQTEKFSEMLVNLVLKKKFLNFSKMIRIFLEYLPSSIDDKQNCSAHLLQRTLEMYFEDYFENSTLKTGHEKSVFEGMKLLARTYLAQLQILQFRNEEVGGNSEINNEKDEDTTNNVLFEDRKIGRGNSCLFAKFRYCYLDRMPPFQVEIVGKMNEVFDPKDDNQNNEISQKKHEADLVLRKLQATLCSPVISRNTTNEVEAFLTLNPNLRGASSLKTLILTNNQAVEFLIEDCPQCLFQFGKDRFKFNEEWKFLIEQLQLKISKLILNDELSQRICFFYKKILKDVLAHIAVSRTVDELSQIFPEKSNILVDEESSVEIIEEICDYDPYFVICKETVHANQIRKLIVTTGQQLISTLNL